MSINLGFYLPRHSPLEIPSETTLHHMSTLQQLTVISGQNDRLLCCWSGGRKWLSSQTPCIGQSSSGGKWKHLGHTTKDDDGQRQKTALAIFLSHNPQIKPRIQHLHINTHTMQTKPSTSQQISNLNTCKLKIHPTHAAQLFSVLKKLFPYRDIFPSGSLSGKTLTLGI